MQGCNWWKEVPILISKLQFDCSINQALQCNFLPIKFDYNQIKLELKQIHLQKMSLITLIIHI